jgi:hypothetical protein
VAKWQNNPSKRNKLKAALTADGYAIVRLVGTELDAGKPQQGATGLSRRIHWRRGHWRMQPYGPESALRRRIWIKPMLVGSDAGQGVEPLHGHIYMAEPSDRVQ